MALDRDEVGSSLLGGALGGIVLAVVLQAAGSPSIRSMGAMVGSPTLAAGGVVLLITSLVFGAGYAFVVTRYVDRYVSTVLSVTARSAAARRLVMPLTRRFGMALVVTTAMGLLYGLAVGIGFGGVVVPAITSNVAFVDPVVVVGYVLFGAVLGGTYGKLVMG